jgi:hypothetical protein
MREFMHYITNAFYGATGWNEDNTYKELNATARGRFPPPLLLSLLPFRRPCPSSTLANINRQSSSISPSLEDFV